MKRKAILPGLVLILCPLTLTSCFSSSKVKNEASVGKQLTDLDLAYRQGVITEKEYLKLRKAIINKND